MSYGAGSQQLSIFSFTHKDLSIWMDNNHLIMPVFPNGPNIYIYNWDLYKLADKFGGLDSENFATVGSDYNLNLWKTFWASSFNMSTAEIYSPIDSFFAVNPFNLYKHSQKSRIGFEYKIKIPENEINIKESENFKAETIMWESCIYPGYPVLIASTTPETEHFGPLFLESASFSVDGSDNLASVTTQFSFSGGTTFRTVNLPPESLDTTDNPNSSIFAIPNIRNRYYRNANLSDCLFDYNAYSSLSDFYNSTLDARTLEGQDPTTRIVSIKLDIKQDWEYKYTSNSGKRTNKHGPKYAATNRFNVTGTIKYLSKSDKIHVPSTSEMSVYFGGPFLFVMDNVDFSGMTVVLSPGKGWTHTINFVARASESTFTAPYRDGKLNIVCSQFKPIPVTFKETYNG